MAAIREIRLRGKSKKAIAQELDLDKDEPIPVQQNLEDLLRAETDIEDEEALSLADFADEQ